MLLLNGKWLGDKHDQFEKIGSKKCECEKCYLTRVRGKFQKSLEEHGFKKETRNG